ncbi:MAG: ABC transporter permease subunit [Symbiobacteriaceae bacterium]|nr:ABC transporter permease subunit [Symbiobacteriaceae bacterium]
MAIFWAMLKKDLQVLRRQRQVVYITLIIPTLLAVVMPLILVFVTLQGFGQEASGMIAIAPANLTHLSPDMQQLVILVDYMMPAYFLMVPIMVGSVFAAGGMITEREHKTMEALLYTPLSLRQLLSAKLFAALVPALVVSWLSALGTALAINIPCWLLRGITPFPSPIWWVILFWVLPLTAALGLTFSLLISASAQTYQEAQQKSALLVVPLTLLLTGNITGVIAMDLKAYFLLGAAFLLANIILLILASRRYRVEQMI